MTITFHFGWRKQAMLPSVSIVREFMNKWSADAAAPLDIGKFLNGQTIANYMKPPKGWDHIDTLVSN